MRFAAGITASGVLTLILLELFKIIGPSVQGWVLGILALALKTILVGLVLAVAATVIGVGIFMYRRGKKASVEV